MGMYTHARNRILPTDRVIAIDIAAGLNRLAIAQKYGASTKTVQDRLNRMHVTTLANGTLRLPASSSQPTRNPTRITYDGKAITLPFISMIADQEKHA